MRWRLMLLIVLTLLALYIPVHAQEQTKCDLNNLEDYLNRADTKRYSGDYSGAVADYTCALEKDPNNTRALFGRAYSYQFLNDLVRAERDYSRLLELDPKNADAYNNRGNIYFSQDDYDRARADYDRAIELAASDQYITYTNRANLNYEQERYQDALNDLNAALKLNPDYQSAYLSRALAYRALNEDEKSRQDIERWISYLEQKSIDLAAADLKEGEKLDMSTGWIYHIPLDAKAGQIIHAEAHSAPYPVLDPMMVLLGPDGSAIAWEDDTEGSLDSVMHYEVKDDGEYTLLVTHAGGGSEGRFLLTVEVTEGS